MHDVEIGKKMVKQVIVRADKKFTVTQAAGCHFNLAPAELNVSSAGGTGYIAFKDLGSTCSWTVTNDSPSWITDVSATSGTGSPTGGAITYNIAANPGIRLAERFSACCKRKRHFRTGVQFLLLT